MSQDGSLTCTDISSCLQELGVAVAPSCRRILVRCLDRRYCRIWEILLGQKVGDEPVWARTPSVGDKDWRCAGVGGYAECWLVSLETKVGDVPVLAGMPSAGWSHWRRRLAMCRCWRVCRVLGWFECLMRAEISMVVLPYICIRSWQIYRCWGKVNVKNNQCGKCRVLSWIE